MHMNRNHIQEYTHTHSHIHILLHMYIYLCITLNIYSLVIFKVQIKTMQYNFIHTSRKLKIAAANAWSFNINYFTLNIHAFFPTLTKIFLKLLKENFKKDLNL